jgi:VanZ family protein
MSKINPRISLPLIAIFLFWICILASTFVMLIDLTPKTGGWPYWDKVQHIMGFGVLTTIGCFAYMQKKTWICAGLVTYGALIEYFQSVLTISRTASFGDWLADIFGVAMGVAVYVMIKNLRAKSTTTLTSSAV